MNAVGIRGNKRAGPRLDPDIVRSGVAAPSQRHRKSASAAVDFDIGERDEVTIVYGDRLQAAAVPNRNHIAGKQRTQNGWLRPRLAVVGDHECGTGHWVHDEREGGARNLKAVAEKEREQLRCPESRRGETGRVGPSRGNAIGERALDEVDRGQLHLRKARHQGVDGEVLRGYALAFISSNSMLRKRPYLKNRVEP